MAISLNHHATRRSIHHSAGNSGDNGLSIAPRIAPLASHLLHFRERPFGRSAKAIGESGLSTFRMVYARPLHFHCVPVERPALSQATTFNGTNLQRRLGSMLRQPLTVNEIHSPSVISCETTVFRFMFMAKYSTNTRNGCSFSLTTPEPLDCWLLLAINLEPLPASLSPSGHHRDPLPGVWL